MSIKFIASIILCFAVALSASDSFAEKIHLKDGQVLEAEIVERGQHYIVTKTGKSHKKYYLSQIDHR